MDRNEYIKIPAKFIPDEFIHEYKLHNKIYKGHVYFEICKGIYDLPQAGRLTNNFLRKILAPCGYIEFAHTPSMWQHIWRPVDFTLVVDDFGVNFNGVKHLQHLIASLEKYYEI